METKEMIDKELSDDYFYDVFALKCEFLKQNDDINDMNFCNNPDNSEQICNHSVCPLWKISD